MSYNERLNGVKSINIFGVTGSIGRSTLTTIDSLSDRNEIIDRICGIVSLHDIKLLIISELVTMNNYIILLSI